MSATTASDPAPTSPTSTSIFRSFQVDGFEEWPSWQRLRRILTSNGGCFGVVGPRGAGKSWLMQRAIAEAQRAGGVGLWFPSPSEDDPEAFLSALSDTFAAEIVNELDRRPSVAVPLMRRLLIPLTIFVTLAATVGVNTEALLSGSPLSWGLTAAVALALLVVAVGWSLVAELRPTGRLRKQAQTLQERIRFSSTLKEAGEAGVAGRGWVSFKSTQERALVERPTTVSSLVHDFRRLAENCAGVVSPGRVVIVIDELDKMSSAEAVARLLRNVKGIFEIPGVHFLVSVSYEAARMLRLGGVVERNEFNSSFYTVIELPPLPPTAGAAMLLRRAQLARAERLRELRELERVGRMSDEQRHELELLQEERPAQPVSPDLPLPEDDAWSVAFAVSIMAAGNPRETVRLYELVSEYAADDGCPPRELSRALETIVTAELRELRREAFAFTGDDEMRPLTDAERVGLHDMIERLSRPVVPDPAAAGMQLDEEWDADWAARTWVARFEEVWRRILVRRCVASELRERPLEIVADPALAMALCEAAAQAQQSAEVARRMLADSPIGALVARAPRLPADS